MGVAAVNRAVKLIAFVAPLFAGSLVEAQPQPSTEPIVFIWGADEESGESVWLGSGFLLGATGEILTARHVVADRPDGQGLLVSISRKAGPSVRVDTSEVDCLATQDVCIIRVPAEVIADLNIVEFYRLGCYMPAIDAPVVAAGFVARADSQSGAVTLRGQLIGDLTTGGLLPTSLPMEPGMSGGPVFDANMTVIGIVKASSSQFGLVQPLQRSRSLLESYGFDCLAAEIPVPSPQIPATLVLAEQVSLPFTPEFLFFSDSYPVVVKNQSGGNSTVLSLDGQSLKEVGRIDLPHSVEGIVGLSTFGGFAAVGNRDGRGLVSFADPSGYVQTTFLSGSVFLPSLAVGESGSLYIANAISNEISVISGGKERAHADASQIVYRDGKGVISLSVFEEEGVAFIVDALSTRLTAIELVGGRSIGEIGYSDSGSRNLVPYAASIARIESEGRALIILGDYKFGTLTSAEFDPRFRNLLPLSFARLNSGMVGDDVDYEGERYLARSPLMIAASRDQKVVLVGSPHSMQLQQFSRPIESDALEMIGTITLPRAPGAIIVSESGEEAYVAFVDDHRLLRLRAGDAGSTGEGAVGDDQIRQLQRQLTEIGLPVGAVDGLMGPATIRAVELVRTIVGGSFPVTDLAAALDAANEIQLQRERQAN